MTQDAPLPSAPDSEAYLVAACVADAAQLELVAKKLPPGAFVSHRAAMGELMAMHRQGVPHSPAVLKSKLEKLPEFREPGSAAAYLFQLGQDCPTTAHVPYHAASVAEAFAKRRLCLMGIDLANEARNGKASDELLANWAAEIEDMRRERSGETRFQAITARELADGEYRLNFIIDWMLVEGQPCILAGGKKTLKTTILCAMLLAIATGGLFLGRWQVGRARRVVLLSGESGLATLQETCRRIAASMGLDLADVKNFTLSPDLPRLDSHEDLIEFEAFIEGLDAEVVAIDPIYLCMAGDDAGNLFKTGALLVHLTKLCQRLGVTLILCHHTRKHRSAELGAFDPPELEDISWAGFQEFARQWLLVGRRSRYIAGTGEHRLWLNYGGSAGHGGLWALDVSEGPTGEAGGRRFDVALAKPSEVRDQADMAKAEAKAKQNAAQLEGDRTAVCNVLAKKPDGMTPTAIRDAAGISGRRFPSVIAAMIELEEIEGCEVTVANQKTPRDGYKLKGELDA